MSMIPPNAIRPLRVLRGTFNFRGLLGSHEPKQPFDLVMWCLSDGSKIRMRQSLEVEMPNRFYPSYPSIYWTSYRPVPLDSSPVSGPPRSTVPVFGSKRWHL